MASPSPAPSGARNRRRSRPPSPAGSLPASPPQNRRRSEEGPPPFLGLACSDGFYPAAEPHPSAKRATALARKADFKYRFVPWVREVRACGASKKMLYEWGWFPLGARDGRVLVQSKHIRGRGSPRRRFRFGNYSYAVCDPLFRQYVLLPPIPDDLILDAGSLVNFGLRLAPSPEDWADTSSFRVICAARYETKLVVLVFSSVTRQWGIATSSDWSSLGAGIFPELYDMERFDEVDGCFYWAVPREDKILMLDALKMELSVISYAYQVASIYRVCIAVDREGTPGMLTVCEYLGNREFRLSRIAKQSGHESANEHLSENIIQLPSYHDEYAILGAAEGFIFLRGLPVPDDEEVQDSPSEDLYMEPEQVYYSLNVKTAEFERVCTMEEFNFSVCPYFRF